MRQEGGWTPTRTHLALAAMLLALPGARSHAQPSQASDAAASAEAARSLDPDVRGYRRGCPGKAIAVAVQPALLNPAVTARIVSLSASSCFGQPGHNAYLVAKGPRGWERVLSAAPGFIEVEATRHGGYADLTLAYIGMCRFSYRWNGRGYVSAGSEGCGNLGQAPAVKPLPQAAASGR